MIKINMYNRLSISILAIISLSVISLISCGESEIIIPPEGNYNDGFFVVNEGIFTNGNASLTYITNDYSVTEEKIFKGINGENLGDIAQSMVLYEDKAYIVVNNSDKIEVVNRFTMKRITTITGSEIKNPSRMVVYEGKGYISNWGVGESEEDDTIVVIDLTTDTIIDTISVGFVPNQLVVHGDKLYVAIQGWATIHKENKVDVIDLNTNTKLTSIEVGFVPNSIVTHTDKIYVLSDDSLITIDASETVINSLDFTGFDFPKNLVNHEGNLYYSLDNYIYKSSDTATELPTSYEFEIGQPIYGLTINEDLLYVNSLVDGHPGESVLSVYDLNTNELLQENIKTGIYSNSVVFN